MKFKLELKRSEIADEIKRHFEISFNPLNPQLDMLVKFNTKYKSFIYTIEILYSTCNINIYNDGERVEFGTFLIQCQCLFVPSLFAQQTRIPKISRGIVGIQ